MARVQDYWYLKIRWKQPNDNRIHQRIEAVNNLSDAYKIVKEYRRKYSQVTGEVLRKILEIYDV